MRSRIEAAEMSFLCRVAGLSFRNGVEELRVQRLLLCVERRRWGASLEWISFLVFSILQLWEALTVKEQHRTNNSLCWRTQAEWSYSKVALHTFPLFTCFLLGGTCFMVSGCWLHWPVILCSCYGSMKTVLWHSTASFLKTLSANWEGTLLIAALI